MKRGAFFGKQSEIKKKDFEKFYFYSSDDCNVVSSKKSKSSMSYEFAKKRSFSLFCSFTFTRRRVVNFLVALVEKYRNSFATYVMEME